MVNYSGSWNGGLFTYDGTVLHDGDRFKTTIDREWRIDYQSPTGGGAGATTISSGTLQIGAGGTAGTLGSGSVSIAAGAALALNRSDATSVSNAITSDGGVNNTGGGGGGAGATTTTYYNGGTGGSGVVMLRYFGGPVATGGTVALGAGTLTVATAAVDTFAGGITGSGGLTKQGVGNLILTGSSSYTGATSVAAGRLSVNGALGNSPVTVLALAELGGSGSIAGPVSIDANGTLSPGNSIASLATGTATFASGATFEYEVDSTDLNALGTAADLLVVTGDLNIGNGTLLTLTDLASAPNPFVEDTTIFALINYSGSWSSGLFTYGTNELADGERFMVGAQQWEIDYNASAGGLNFTGDYVGSSFVTITAVPEPSTLALMAIGAGLAVAAGLRRRAFVGQCLSGEPHRVFQAARALASAILSWPVAESGFRCRTRRDSSSRTPP